jgi:hypothetical protein
MCLFTEVLFWDVSCIRARGLVGEDFGLQPPIDLETSGRHYKFRSSAGFISLDFAQAE